MTIVGLGEMEGIGYDTFFAKALYHGGNIGDIYNCTASNIVSMSSYEIGLKSVLHFDIKIMIIHNYIVSSRPTIDSVKQTSSTSVRVEWSQPSGGATVTGYVVHYSDGDTDRNESVPASSTSSLITGLTNCITYNFSVEATSEHLSGESGIMIVELGSEQLHMYMAFA